MRGGRHRGAAVGRALRAEPGGHRGVSAPLSADERGGRGSEHADVALCGCGGRRVGRLQIVDPLKTRLKAGYAAKTDRLDARRLADALRRDSVVGIYYPPLAIRELRELCRSRHALVQTRTALINQLRAVLLRQGVADARRLARTTDDGWLRSFAFPPRATASVATLREVLAVVRTTAARVEAEVRQVAAADPIAQRLQALRGVGPLLAVMIRAEVGEVHRFPSGAHLASYAGLVPRVEASAGRIRYGRITKRGSPWFAWALIEAAHPWHPAVGSGAAAGAGAWPCGKAR